MKCPRGRWKGNIKFDVMEIHVRYEHLNKIPLIRYRDQ